MFSCRGLIEMFTFGPSIYAVFAFNSRDVRRPRNSAARELYVRVAAGIGKESSCNPAYVGTKGCDRKFIGMVWPMAVKA